MRPRRRGSEPGCGASSALGPLAEVAADLPLPPARLMLSDGRFLKVCIPKALWGMTRSHASYTSVTGGLVL